MDTKNDVKKPLRTFLVQYGVATIGLDGERENFHLGLVVAPNAKTATRYAMKAHADEDLEDGQWIEYNSHRAFQIIEHTPDCDANSIYWINKVTEIPPSDAAVLGKYLPTVDHEETPEKTVAGVLAADLPSSEFLTGVHTHNCRLWTGAEVEARNISAVYNRPGSGELFGRAVHAVLHSTRLFTATLPSDFGPGAAGSGNGVTRGGKKAVLKAV